MMNSFIFIFFYLVKRITKSERGESTRSYETKSGFGFFYFEIKVKVR